MNEELQKKIEWNFKALRLIIENTPMFCTEMRNDLRKEHDKITARKPKMGKGLREQTKDKGKLGEEYDSDGMGGF